MRDLEEDAVHSYRWCWMPQTRSLISDPDANGGFRHAQEQGADYW